MPNHQSRDDQSGLRQKPGRRGDHAWKRGKTRNGSDGRSAGGRCAGSKHLCVYRFGQGRVDRRDSGSPSGKSAEAARPEVNRKRVHVPALRPRAAGIVAGSGRLYWVGSGRRAGRDYRKSCGARFHLANQKERKLETCATIYRYPPDLHPRLRYPALSPDPFPFRLPEDCRRLQSSLQFLRDPANAGTPSEPVSGVGSCRDSSPCRGGRSRNQFDQPGHDLLRNGFVDGKSRATAAG